MLLHLAWRRNLDSYDLALAANRLASRGTPLWWFGASGPAHEPGDYLCDIDGQYIALDGYVAHLPADPRRGGDGRHAAPLPAARSAVMAADPQRDPQPELRFKPPGAMPATPVPAQPPEPKARLIAALDTALRRLTIPEEAQQRSLVGGVRDDLCARVTLLRERLAVVETAFAALDPPAPGIRYLWAGCEAAAPAAVAGATKIERLTAERLAELETALVLAEAWCRLAEGERHFGRVT